MLKACTRVLLLLTCFTVILFVIDISGADVLLDNAEKCETEKPADNECFNEITDITAHNSELVLNDGHNLLSIALLLRKDGVIAAHRLDTGQQVWATDTGGTIASTAVQRHATGRVAMEDPFAKPFFVVGDMLFTRRPLVFGVCLERRGPYSFFCQKDNAVNEGGDREETMSFTAENAEECGKYYDDLLSFASSQPLSPSHPNYFMNISTLLQKNHVSWKDVDIFVTTSARVMDFGLHDGKRAVDPNPLHSYLHVVRYDITIHVQRLGSYEWSINVSQHKITGKLFFDRFSGSLKKKKLTIFFWYLSKHFVG